MRALLEQMHLSLGARSQGKRIPRKRQPAGPFHYFNSSPEVIRLVVMMNVK